MFNLLGHVFAPLTRKILFLSKIKLFRGHTDAKKVTLFIRTEERKNGLDKDSEAGDVHLMSQTPELQEPTASSSASNTVIQLSLGDVSCSKFQTRSLTQTTFGMTQFIQKAIET